MEWYENIPVTTSAEAKRQRRLCFWVSRFLSARLVQKLWTYIE